MNIFMIRGIAGSCVFYLGLLVAIASVSSRALAQATPFPGKDVQTDFAARCIQLGTTFTAVGIDVSLLLNGSESLRAKFR